MSLLVAAAIIIACNLVGWIADGIARAIKGDHRDRSDQFIEYAFAIAVGALTAVIW